MARRYRVAMGRVAKRALKLSKQRAATEFLILFRFGIVGVVSTAVHLGIVTGLIVYFSLHPVAANAVAYLAAFSVSFTGHFHWSFNTGGARKRALLRFFLASGSAFALNNVLLVALLKAHLLSDIASTIAAVLVMPLFTFVLSRFWVFKPRPLGHSASLI